MIFLYRKFALSVTLVTIMSSVATAQVSVEPRNVTFESEQQVPVIPDDVDTTIEQADAGKSRKSGEFVVAPLPSRSPLLGWTLTLPAMYLYRPSQVDDDEPAWITGAMGLYSENDSKGVGLFHRMHLDEDRWRLMGAAFYADMNYDFFGIGGNPDTSIPLNQLLRAYLLQALRQVRPNLFVGLRATGVAGIRHGGLEALHRGFVGQRPHQRLRVQWITDANLFVGLRATLSNSEVRLKIPDGILPPGVDLPDVSANFDLTTLAPRLQYDSRDNEFYPTAGMLVEGAVALGREALGSDNEYEKYEFDVNGYRSIAARCVGDTALALEYVSGDAPFFVLPAFGAGADLRGYQTGSYRDRFMFAAQAEYRHRIGEKIRLVAFGGVGTTAADFAGWSSTLWSIGTGFRWVVAPQNQMSLRVDIARGRDETEFYVGLGEAF